jgi:SAM-dependent methyltransferase
MLMLREKVPASWLPKILANLPAVLVDHAHLERKAATTALNLEKYRSLYHRVEDLNAILDFGCGCGRMLRHWVELPRTRVFGCDIDPRMVRWCDENLPFAEVGLNELEPPLRYANSTFDLVYAFSVFTHLDVELQHAWMQESLRVLRPNGLLLISTLGEHYLSLRRLTDSEEQAFRNGEVVVLYEQSAGSSLCSAYHPPDYVRESLGADFDLVTFRPAADEGRHDLHLFRKPSVNRVGTEQTL